MTRAVAGPGRAAATATRLLGGDAVDGAVGPPVTFDAIGITFPNGVQALDGVDLRVDAGEFVAVVGPSGCGKSTLLRIASGLTRPSAGRAVVTARQVGYVFQDPTLLPWRTVQRNVELCTQLRDLPRAERRERARQAIEMVGLAGFEHHHPNQLSGGMRMRTSLARMLTLRPDVFLFDEPFGAIDEITRERLNDELQQIYRSTRFTGLFVTHSIPEAVYLSTRVVVMSPRPGRIVGDFAVPFGYPRVPHLRAEAAFAALAGEISDCLREATC